jgi:hypothetical protein
MAEGRRDGAGMKMKNPMRQGHVAFGEKVCACSSLSLTPYNRESRKQKRQGFMTLPFDFA